MIERNAMFSLLQLKVGGFVCGADSYVVLV